MVTLSKIIYAIGQFMCVVCRHVLVRILNLWACTQLSLQLLFYLFVQLISVLHCLVITYSSHACMCLPDNKSIFLLITGVFNKLTRLEITVLSECVCVRTHRLYWWCVIGP